MSRVLLMYISNNSGHHHAAMAVEEALYQLSSDMVVLNINGFNYTNPILEKVINSIYNKVIKSKPEVWEYLYDNPDIVRRTRKLRQMIHKFNSKKLLKLLNNFKPDAVVCTQAFPCGMIADLKKTHGMKFPLIGVLTDYAPHSYWSYDNVDAYVVPGEQSKNKFISNGIDKDKIFIYGIPLKPRFTDSCSKNSVFEECKLDEAIPAILIMGGSQGLGPIQELIYAINTIENDFQVIVVCGTNRKLRKWLEKRKKLFRKKMITFGYTEHVNAMMDVACMIVTKPGGLTTAEALVKGLPIVIINPIPGQEAMNTNFLLEEKVAVRANSPLDAAILIEDLLNHPAKLNRMKAAALKQAQPHSSSKIAKLILDLIKGNGKC